MLHSRKQVPVYIFVLLLTISTGIAQIPNLNKNLKEVSGNVKFNKILFNGGLSPRYINSTKKYLKNAQKSEIASNSAATAKCTVTLIKGGVEGNASSQTTESPTVTSDGYTCVTRNVKEKVDFFHQPMFSNGDVIYPGALLNATSYINNQIGYYALPSSYRREPYRISANLFTMTSTPQNPTETIGDNEDYSLASFRAAKSLILNRNAAANPPVEAFIEYINANTKEEVGLKLGYNFTANIPAELSALIAGIPVGVNANLSASAIANQASEKSRIILKITYNFYSMDASPTHDDPTKFLTPSPGNDIPSNVVFVSSVLYGTTGYVYFESDKTSSELQTAISEVVGLSGPLGQGSASVNISAEARSKFSSTVTKMLAYGKGLGVQPGISTPVTNLDNLLNLIGNLKSWGPNNQGSPIAFTMNFVHENNGINGLQALVSYSTSFPNKVCTVAPIGDLKYDVDLELDHIEVKVVKDLSGNEDLFGKLEFSSFKSVSKEVNKSIVYWSQSEDKAGATSFKKGIRHVDVRNNLIKNLTLNELKNSVLTIGGQLHDDEGVFGSRNFRCNDCQQFSGDYGKLTLNFFELETTKNSINALQADGNYHELAFGGDNYFELNFYESNNKNDGWTLVKWKVLVKAHQ